jgi:DivIVA domain-containing protein
MMELTPLDVRKKKGDFRRGLRGYEPGVVDDFLDLVADRLEGLVREAAAQKERVARLEGQVAEYRDREKALTEALVTAQEMREEIRSQSSREVEFIRRQAEQDADAIKGEAVRAREREEESLNALRAKQLQFLASYRAFLEQELSDLAAHARAVEMQAGRAAHAATPAAPSRPQPARPPAAAPPPPATPSAASPPPRRRPSPRDEAGDAPVMGTATPPGRPPVAEPTVKVPAYARAQRPAFPAREAVRDPGDAEIDAHVGAALAEWTTEFDDIEGGGEEPELILSDADMVDEAPDMFATPAEPGEPAAPAAEEPKPPPYDESAFREEVKAAFGDTHDPPDDLLDLDSFDSFRGGVDPALGESIVGPPPVIPPDQLTISPVFLERAGGASGESGDEAPDRRDMISSMFEDDG